MFARLRKIVWLWLSLAVGALPLCAATKAEEKAFQEATLAYDGKAWPRAERELGAFVARFPASEFRAEALLLQAQSRIHLGNFAGAIALLNTGRGSAGRFADEYLFFLAEARFQGGQFQAAADSYATFGNAFTNSARLLDATVAEAAARSRLKQWPRVVELLADPNGRFQSLAAASPGLEASVRGRFLWCEALIAQEKFGDAAQALEPLVSQPLDSKLAWQRDYLRARIFLAQDQLPTALALTTNLNRLAADVSPLLAEGRALQAGIHEELGQTESAIAAWQLNLDPEIPAERQREALLRVGDLLIHLNRLSEAATTLAVFTAQNTNDVATDVINLTIGELRLRESLVTNGTPAASLLLSAQEAFDAVLSRPTAPDVAGRAYLGRGWCLWLSDRVNESASAFTAATEKLPPGLDQSVARFKLADAQARQGDWPAALNNYQLVLAAAAGSPLVRSGLVESSLYQILKSAREVNDNQAANEAMARLLADYPGGALIEPALVLFSREGETRANPAERRDLLEAFLQQSPGSKLRAGVRLAITRTFEQEQNWTAAAAAYESWLTDYPDEPARPRAEYLLALATARTGDETNALERFTRFIANHPGTEFTPLARWWMADYYLRQEEFIKAETDYQLVFKQHPDSPLRFEAQLMAGRAALARGALKEAVDYFTALINDERCPPGVEARAYFAYGDALMSATDYETARQPFSKILQLFPDERIALLAQVKIGNCFLQLGGLNPTNALENYNLATNAYCRVLTATNHLEFADRAEAEVGLGLALERQAKLLNGTNGPALQQAAMEHYLNVIYGSARREDEPTDMFWVKRAGLEALTLAESVQAWEKVGPLCRTLAAQLPSLQSQLDKRRERAEEELRKTSD